jgi:hypothetical protein
MTQLLVLGFLPACSSSRAHLAAGKSIEVLNRAPSGLGENILVVGSVVVINSTAMFDDTLVQGGTFFRIREVKALGPTAIPTLDGDGEIRDYLVKIAPISNKSLTVSNREDGGINLICKTTKNGELALEYSCDGSNISVFKNPSKIIRN